MFTCACAPPCVRPPRHLPTCTASPTTSIRPHHYRRVGIAVLFFDAENKFISSVCESGIGQNCATPDYVFNGAPYWVIEGPNE